MNNIITECNKRNFKITPIQNDYHLMRLINYFGIIINAKINFNYVATNGYGDICCFQQKPFIHGYGWDTHNGVEYITTVNFEGDWKDSLIYIGE